MEQRKIAIENFYGEGEHIFIDQLGWQLEEKKEARSLVSKDIFEFEIIHLGMNMSFYYLDNDTFYGIHTEQTPIEFKELTRDTSEPYIGWQCDGNTHNDGKILYSFEHAEDIWDNVRINGKNLEEVIERSYILELD